MNSCASQASTAVCMSLDQPSSSAAAAASNQFGGRTIDRHNPIIRDTRRTTPKTALSLPPCTSQPPPINPLPYRLLQKSTKDQIKFSISRKSNAKKKEKKNKQTSDVDERKKKEFSAPAPAGKEDAIVKKNWGKRVGADLVTPPGSSRYLLSEKDLIDYDPVLALVPVPATSTTQSNNHNLIHCSSSSASNASLQPSSQVVVLKVSLHCRGCEGKVRKHISRMEGVKSFNIDFAAKKVTIEGEVTPLGVLASISKVKNAQFWTLPSLSTK